MNVCALPPVPLLQFRPICAGDGVAGRPPDPVGLLTPPPCSSSHAAASLTMNVPTYPHPPHIPPTSPPLPLVQVMELLADHLSQWACHVSFPELAHLTTLQLRKFVKATPVDRFR